MACAPWGGDQGTVGTRRPPCGLAAHLVVGLDLAQVLHAEVGGPRALRRLLQHQRLRGAESSAGEGAGRTGSTQSQGALTTAPGRSPPASRAALLSPGLAPRLPAPKHRREGCQPPRAAPFSCQTDRRPFPGQMAGTSRASVGQTCGAEAGAWEGSMAHDGPPRWAGLPHGGARKTLPEDLAVPPGFGPELLACLGSPLSPRAVWASSMAPQQWPSVPGCAG